MPQGQWFGLGFGREPIGDLKAIQAMIDNANDITEKDLQKVLEATKAVTAAREALDQGLGLKRAQLKSACSDYANAKRELLFGEDGQRPLRDACVEAQGKVNNLLALGLKANGCVDACAAPGSGTKESAPGACARGACYSTLKATQQLQNVLGPAWERKDVEMQKVCGAPGYRIQVVAPQGWGDAEEVTEQCAA
eukprot:CAMPEP_0180424560 /NCGR_PEP_ID=MMETSP1036_2-20121128/4803_1 /TAXON_ID=632150 /ORGANISM="Azadinium spinosum, Strain 3D9" /LENGTH=193 /DNA_ID=CAMNT_0022430007 /DNA_START=109 /DNA_END=687 /DNA_ORIENTATION=+